MRNRGYCPQSYQFWFKFIKNSFIKRKLINCKQIFLKRKIKFKSNLCGTLSHYRSNQKVSPSFLVEWISFFRNFFVFCAKLVSDYHGHATLSQTPYMPCNCSTTSRNHVRKAWLHVWLCWFLPWLFKNLIQFGNLEIIWSALSNFKISVHKFEHKCAWANSLIAFWEILLKVRASWWFLYFT